MIWSLHQTTRSLLIIACLSSVRMFADDSVKFQNSSTHKWTVTVDGGITTHVFDTKSPAKVSLKNGEKTLADLLDKITLKPGAEALEFTLSKSKKADLRILRLEVADTQGPDKAMFTFAVKDGKAKLFLESCVLSKNEDVKDVFDYNSPEDGSFVIKNR
jgi:hypothetical protein